MEQKKAEMVEYWNNGKTTPAWKRYLFIEAQRGTSHRDHREHRAKIVKTVKVVKIVKTVKLVNRYP